MYLPLLKLSEYHKINKISERKLFSLNKILLEYPIRKFIKLLLYSSRKIYFLSSKKEYKRLNPTLLKLLVDSIKVLRNKKKINKLSRWNNKYLFLLLHIWPALLIPILSKNLTRSWTWKSKTFSRKSCRRRK